MSESDPLLRLSITPQPTEEELAAIVSAIVAVVANRSSEVENVQPTMSRWERAGRRDAIRGLDDVTERSWKRR